MYRYGNTLINCYCCIGKYSQTNLQDEYAKIGLALGKRRYVHCNNWRRTLESTRFEMYNRLPILIELIAEKIRRRSSEK